MKQAPISKQAQWVNREEETTNLGLPENIVCQVIFVSREWCCNDTFVHLACLPEMMHKFFHIGAISCQSDACVSIPLLNYIAWSSTRSSFFLYCMPACCCHAALDKMDSSSSDLINVMEKLGLSAVQLHGGVLTTNFKLGHSTKQLAGDLSLTQMTTTIL